MVIVFSVLYRKYFQTLTSQWCHSSEGLHILPLAFRSYMHKKLLFVCGMRQKINSVFSGKKSISVYERVPSPVFGSSNGAIRCLCAQTRPLLTPLSCTICLRVPASSSKQPNRCCFTMTQDTQKKTFPVFLLLHKKTLAFINTANLFFPESESGAGGRGGGRRERTATSRLQNCRGGTGFLLSLRIV